MKRFVMTLAVVGSLLALPAPALAANGDRIGSPQTQPNPSGFVTTYQACLGPLRSEIAQGEFAGFGPFGEHFTGAVDPGAHYGSVGEAAFLAAFGLKPSDCAALVSTH
ncbi:MAG TPA: hypothetical protein VIN39_10500, partial [Candidatus Dormibacteraeota bacterium]|jgi:hypothetical protein